MEIKAAVVLFALLIIVVVPFLIRDSYRLKRHVRPNSSPPERAKAPE